MKIRTQITQIQSVFLFIRVYNPIYTSDGVPEMCVVNLDNLQTIQKTRLGARITTLSARRMQDVQRAIQFALGMDNYL